MEKGGSELFLGIDVGSVSANTVVVDGTKKIVEEHYHRLHGQPISTVRAVLENIFTRIQPEQLANISFVGTGGKLLATLLGAQFVNEIIAQGKAIEHFHPAVRTVIEMGGEDSKLLLLDYDSKNRPSAGCTDTMCRRNSKSFWGRPKARPIN